MFAPAVMTPSASFSLPEGLPNYNQLPQRRPSLAWPVDAGLPPPPCEIDRYRDLQHSLVPSSPFAHPPSSYDMHFGEQGEGVDDVPTNAVTKHPKVKLKIILSDTLYEAGSSISGALEVTSSTSQRLRIGEIAIELEAFEELTSREHSATQIFLFNRTLFQGEHLPPSNAVLPAAPVHGHWTARKGRTTFPFSFRLPATAPSSVNFAGNAHLRYTLKGTVQTWWNESKSLVTVRSDAFVVEKWHDEFDSRYLEPIEAVADTHIFMGGSGAVWLEACVVEQLFIAGSMVMIRAGVKNNTKRNISGIKVAIARRLIFPVSGLPGAPAQRPSLEPQITEVVHTQLFKGPSFEFPPNEEIVTNLAVDLPRDLRTIRKTRLFEVQIVAQISAQMGNFAKDLTVEIPIYVAHSSSMQKSATEPLEPLQRLPQRSRSAMSQHGYHNQPVMHQDHGPSSPQLQYNPQMMPMEAYGAERGWSPAPHVMASMGPPSRPSSAAPNLGFTCSPSPDPFAFVPGRKGQEPQVMWNTNVVDWTTNQILQSLPPPRPVSAQDQSRSNTPADSLSIQHQRGPTAGSTHLLTNQRRSESTSQLSPQPQAQHTLAQEPLPSSSQPSQPQSDITMSQLLSLGAVSAAGLATIEEDSESAAGTVRSIRTLVGTVNRNDVAQFEAMVEEAREEEERDNAIEGEMIDKSLPRPPIPSVKATLSNRRPRVSELFDAPQSQTIEMANVAPKPSPLSSHTVSTPNRPSSAQGMGLQALESRLGSQRTVTVQEPVLKKVINRQSELQESSPKAANRAAEEIRAAERESRLAQERKERKAKQEAEEAALLEAQKEAQDEARRQDEITKQEQLKAKEAVQAMNHLPNREATVAKVSESKGKRKTVDVVEQKKLNKEAVGRVTGWLSTSPSNSRGVGEDASADPALSPITPSPSVFKEMEEEAKSSIPTSALNIQTLVGSSGNVDESTPTLSADLRALIDSSDARPTPKQGTAIRKHAASRRFSNDNIQEEPPKLKPSASGRSSLGQSRKSDIPSAASRGIPTSKVSTSSALQAITNNAEADDGGKSYDVRSARGGKGGRVASVANMWASIADGTDGSNKIPLDDAPVLTLRPKALRSGVSGSSALDFSKAKVEENRKPSAMDIFANPPAPANSDGIKNPPAKTKKAANFINTTSPKPVFSKVASPTQVVSNRKMSIEKVEPLQSSDLLKESRKIASDLVVKEAKLKAGRDPQIDIATGVPTSMNGRGTTKAIGRNRLADLRTTVPEKAAMTDI